MKSLFSIYSLWVFMVEKASESNEVGNTTHPAPTPPRVRVCVCVSVVVSGGPSNWSVGSSDEEPRRWTKLWSSTPPCHTDPGQAAGEEELPESSPAAGESQPQGWHPPGTNTALYLTFLSHFQLGIPNLLPRLIHDAVVPKWNRGKWGYVVV